MNNLLSEILPKIIIIKQTKQIKQIKVQTLALNLI